MSDTAGLLGGLLEGPLIVALDVDTAEDCLRLARLLKGRAHAYKMGPRLCMRYGAELVKQVAAIAPVFVDNKYLDIPSTMEAAIRATHDAGATLATIHTWSGPEALTRLAKVEAELSSKRPFKLLAVTLLTSFSKDNLPPTIEVKSFDQNVSALADSALKCGLTGLVCSPHEVSNLRSKSKTAFLVTPGIRLATDAAGDQKRIETPAAALKKGASALVVGRPIVEAQDPVEAAERVLSSIAEAKR
ncbi:MAG: orotidine-5'-phosphate decarboxylase [Bdellovibrionota bacterium]